MDMSPSYLLISNIDRLSIRIKCLGNANGVWGLNAGIDFRPSQHVILWLLILHHIDNYRKTPVRLQKIEGRRERTACQLGLSLYPPTDRRKEGANQAVTSPSLPIHPPPQGPYRLFLSSYHMGASHRQLVQSLVTDHHLNQI